MSDPISEGVNTTETGDETQSLTGQEPGDVNSTGINLSAPVTSWEVTRQIRATIDAPTKQLECLCKLMKEFRQGPSKSNKDTSGLI